MLTPDEIRIKLKDMNLKAVSRGCNVPYNTLYNFSNGKDSRVSVVQKISDYLEGKMRVMGNDDETT